MTSKSRKQEYPDIEQEIDILEFRESIISYFSWVEDPRRKSGNTYRIEHVFFIILSALLAGANSIKQIAVFSKVKARWIRNLLEIETTPSYGVFWWILVRLKPELLRQLLEGWLKSLPEELRERVLAIDGKCLRGTQNIASDTALHLVSLFAVESGVIIAQQPVENKSNEIKAIPNLLEKINIRGTVITIDAIGCQKKIAQKICDKDADYMLALKGNAGALHDEIMLYFKEAAAAGYEYLDHTYHYEEDLGHGRKVSRTIRSVHDVEWIPQLDEWSNLKGLVQVVSVRTVNGKSVEEERYYITSLQAGAEKLARIIRAHWAIENNLHRQLDVNFMEDDSPINTGHAAENLATFRRMALNILGSGRGLSDRRKTAAWDEDYLTALVVDFVKSF